MIHFKLLHTFLVVGDMWASAHARVVVNIHFLFVAIA